jgi:predicted NUDIX family NTP pyrophosphohydrolase
MSDNLWPGHEINLNSAVKKGNMRVEKGHPQDGSESWKATQRHFVRCTGIKVTNSPKSTHAIGG